MKFKELMRREALAACAVATLSLPALADNPPNTDTTAGNAADSYPHHGDRHLLREMAKASGDPTGEVAVPHLHMQHTGTVVTDRKSTEADRFKEPQSSLDMKLYQFKED